jgi:hypothetical protein
MRCQGCERLKKERTEAKEAFDAARERLRASTGAAFREEHQDLLQSVLTSHLRLNLATIALDRHIRNEHKHQSEASDAEAKNHESDSGQPEA